MNSPPPVRPKGFVEHPLWWGACALLLLNDHVLKGSGWVAPAVTGKLSDFAGLLAAPAALAFALRLRTRRALFAIHVGIAALFSALKLLPVAARLWERTGECLGLSWHVWCDPTDLVALPVLLLSWRYISSTRRPVPRRAWRRLVETSGAAIGIFSCLATSRAPPQAPSLTPRVVVMDDFTENRVYVFDRATGRHLFSEQSDVAPVTLNEIVVVYSNGTLHALDAQRAGQKLWAYRPAGTPNLQRCDDGVLVNTGAKSVVLDATTGKPRVELELRDYTAHCAAGLILGTERISSNTRTPDEDALVAFDHHTGQERFRRVDLGFTNWVPLASILVARHDANLQAMDPTTGRDVWRRRLPQSYGVEIVAERDIAILDLLDCCTIAFDARGRELWRRPAKEMIGAGGGRVFFAENDDVVAVDVSSGTPLWRRGVDSISWSTHIAADDDLLVLRTSDTEMLALDAKTGQSAWRASAPKR